MIEVSAFDAKTHLSDLLNKVQKGEHIRITKHKVPIAYLIPYEGQLSSSKDIFAAFKEFRAHKFRRPSSMEILGESLKDEVEL